MSTSSVTLEVCGHRICAIIVTYNPNLEVINAVISSLANEVEKLFIFDNSNESIIKKIMLSVPNIPIRYFHDSSNVGIAAAQNKLLEIALEESFDLAIMSDQDTVYPSGYASELKRYCFLRNNVVAVCPGWLDVNLKGEAKYPGQYVYDSKGSLKIDFSEPEFLEISHAISSGMIVNLHNLGRVGLMREDLFIDWVDNEWCWRSRIADCSILAIPAVKVRHTLGDCTVKVFGKNFVKRNRDRNYYIIRNAVYLALYSRIPYSARKYLIKKIIHHTVFSLLASQEKSRELAYIVKAWMHGLLSKLGRIS